MDVQVIASGSTGNAYIVRDGTSALLLDCGLSYARLMRGCGHRLHEIAGCLLTHEHQDHSKAVESLISRGVDIYSSVGTFAALNIAPKRQRRAHGLLPLETVSIATFNVTPFAVEHDAAEPFGYIVDSTTTGERLLYATDTHYIKYRFNAVSHLLIECNYDPSLLKDNAGNNDAVAARQNRTYFTHMSIDTLLEMLCKMDKSRLARIWLIHMSRDNIDPAAAAERVRRATGIEVYIAHG